MIAVWPNNTKWQTATVLCDIVNGPICIPVIDIRPKYDYLTHKNDPNKAQYNPDDIQHCNGFVLSKYLNLTAAEVSQKVAEITKLCFEFQFYEYADLIKYLLDNDMFDDFDIASNRTLYFSNLIKGIWRKGGQPQKVDFRTGEVLNDDTKGVANMQECCDLLKKNIATYSAMLDNKEFADSHESLRKEIALMLQLEKMLQSSCK